MIPMNTTFPMTGGGILPTGTRISRNASNCVSGTGSAGLTRLPVAACRQSIHRQTWRRFGGSTEVSSQRPAHAVHPCFLASFLEAVHLGDADPAKHQRGKVYPCRRRNVQGRVPVPYRRRAWSRPQEVSDADRQHRNKRLDPRIEERHPQPVPPVGSC